MQDIPAAQVQFDSTSYVDPYSRVFSWNGGIFRAVVPEMADYFRQIISENWFEKLQEKGNIVSTKITDYILDGYGLILSHRKISPLSYCVEWPPQLLKKAALLTVEICLELSNHNLTLQDAYPWNIQFEGTTPVFIDIGSITPMDEDFLWRPYQQFCNFFMFPLYLYGANLITATRLMLYNYLDGISEDECIKMLPASYRLSNPGAFMRLDVPMEIAIIARKLKIEEKLMNMPAQLKKIDFKSPRKKLFKGLIKEIKGIKLAKNSTVWSDYKQGENSFDSPEKWTEKQKVTAQLLDRLKPVSVMDIACNQGWFSLLAAKKGASVIAFDTDEASIGSLCDKADAENLKILPLILNAINPTPKFGWCLKQFGSALDRLHGDMVFAFALIHHLAIAQWQSFDRIVDTLNRFAKKWLLVEFIPADDEKAKALLARKRENYDWYNLENFISALEKKFSDIEIFDSHPQGRKLLLCHKHSNGHDLYVI